MTSVPHSGAKSVTHTPGPWRTNGCYISSNYGEVGHAYFVSSMPEGMADANAYLMAAAPDLLAALQGAIGALEFSQDYHRDLGNEDQAFAADRLDAARAAIAKATAGETRNAEPIHRRDGDAEGDGVNHNALEGQA